MTALSWSHAATEIPDSPLVVRREANAEETERLASALGVTACPMMHADYEIRRVGDDRYLMTGTVFADVTQPCVVTLEPVRQHIEERILVEIGGRASDRQGTEDTELPLLDDDMEHEPLVGGRIEAGRIVFETLAAAIDPYPRKDGAVFDWEDPISKSPGREAGPFAALAKLKSQT